jgi:uncharacterized protein (TIGR02284 family)
MNNSEIITKLSSLMKIDIDAISTYKKVIEKIPESDIKDHLMKFKSDHQRHVDSLKAVIRDLGGTPPSLDVDVKGIFLTGAVMLEQLFNAENALRVLKSGEEVINKTYDESVTKDLPVEIRSILDIHNRDELEHLRYISYAIDIRVWDKAA